MADFQFYLNRQGVRGAKGVKGDKGDSPIVSVNKHTANEYVLQIDNTDGTQIITPNLVGQQIVVNTAGDYVKYDRGSNQFVTMELPSATGEEEGLIRLATDADYAERDEFSAVTPYGLVTNLPSLITTSVDNLIRIFYDEPTDSIVLDTSKIYEDISGVNTIATEALTASQNNTNEINTLKSTATSIDDNTTSADKVWSSSKTNSEISTVANGLVQTQGDVAVLNTDMTEIKPIVQAHTASISSINDSISNLTGKTNPATTTTAGIVKPDGRTITVAEDGTITAAGGSAPDNMVTTDTEQVIPSKKLFRHPVYDNGFTQIQGASISLLRYDREEVGRINMGSSSKGITFYCAGQDNMVFQMGGTSTRYFDFLATSGGIMNRMRYYSSGNYYDIFNAGNLIPSSNITISEASNTGVHIIDISKTLLDRIAALETTVASLQTQIGEIAAKLDTINGEAI